MSYFSSARVSHESLARQHSRFDSVNFAETYSLHPHAKSSFVESLSYVASAASQLGGLPADPKRMRESCGYRQLKIGDAWSKIVLRRYLYSTEYAPRQGDHRKDAELDWPAQQPCRVPSTRCSRSLACVDRPISGHWFATLQGYL